MLKKEESKSNETSSKRKNAESSEGAKGKDREKKKEKKKDKKTCEKKPEKRVEETPAAQEAPEAEQKAPLSPKESTADNVSSSSNSSSNVSEANGEESPKTDEKKLKPKAIAKVVNSARPRSYSENIATPASQPSAEDKDESDSTDKEKKEAVPPTPPRPMMKRKLGPKFPGAKSLPRSGPTKSAAPPLSVTTTPASAATTPPTPTRGHMSLSGIPGLLPPAVPPPRPKVQAQPQVQTHPKVQVKEVPVKVQAKEALPAKQHTKETPAPAPTQNTSGGFKAAQARPSASTTHGQLIGVHTHKKVSVGIVVAPGTCSSTPPVSRPPIPPRTPRSGPVFHQPPPLVLPPSAQKKKDAGKEKEKGMVLKNEKELKEKKEDKEEVVPHAKTSPPSAPIPEEKNEGSTAEAKEVVVVEEKEKEEEEEEEEWEEENKGKGEGDKGDGDDEDKGENGEDDDSNDGETMAEDDDDYDVYVEEKPTEMGFGGMSGDAFLADGGMSFFRDRKIARKSMMYKDTWWTTLRPAKMEAMPITPLLPEDGPDGNDEAIPGFDDNITAVPSMATEIGGDPEEEQSSLPLI